MSARKVLVGLSGGVDSAVASLLLSREGWEPVGVYMKLHDNDSYHEENFAKAKQVADYLGMQLHFLDLSGEFRKEVYDYFVDSYRRGLTPNPCVICNREIKFGEMLRFADTLGIEKVATGHYLRSDGKYIYRALDKEKDQSYFLAEVKPGVIGRLLFPLGELRKSEVVEMAEEIEPLRNIARQKESSEICFVDGDYTEILAKHMPVDMEGEVLDTAGEVVGTHKGYMHYTIGKRRGFTVRGAHEPHYVLGLDARNNRIIVGRRELLAESEFRLRNINLFDDMESFECMLKVRYRTEAVKASVRIGHEGGSVRLHSPVFGLAEGQFAVFYDQERLLGGGEIVKRRDFA